MGRMNRDFALGKEERENQSFFKVLEGADTSSENMRALPYDFVRSFSGNEFSGKMKIRAKWGSSWEIQISKNPRFYFMEKAGWEKFLRDNHLGTSEFLTFTHKGQMCFTVNIFKQDGREMLHPQQSMAFFASSSRIKTEQEGVVSPDPASKPAGTNGGGTYERKLDFVSPDPGSKTAGANGSGTHKSKLDFGKKKAKESSQSSKMTTKAASARRDSAGASSSSVAEFTVLAKKSSLDYITIPASVAKDRIPAERTTFKIHHQDMKNSWKVVYLKRSGSNCLQSIFSAGWRRLAKEYPIAVGDTCKFTFIKPTEVLLVVSTPSEEETR